MASLTSDSPRGRIAPRTLDLWIEGVFVLLLFGSPFALGAVEAWGYGAMEMGVAVLAALFLVRGWRRGRFAWFASPVNPLLFALLLLALLQGVPLPLSAIAWLSPRAAEMVPVEGPSSWTSLALNRTLWREELLKWIAYGATFFIAASWLHEPRRVKRFFGYFVAVGASLTLFALVQLAFWNGKIFWRIETASAFPFGPYVNHNHFAGFIELALGATLGLLLAEIHPVVSGRVRLRDYSATRAILLAGVGALLLIGLLLSRSRGGIVSVLGASAILPLLLQRSESRRALVLALLVLALLVGGALALGSGIALERYRFAGDPSVQYRLATWRDTLALGRDYWRFGCGLGNFAEAFPAYKTGFPGFFTVHPENDYLQALAELGIAGFGLLMALIGIYARGVLKLLRQRRNEEVRGLAAGGMFGLIALSLHGLYDFNFHIPANAFAFVLMAAMTQAIVALHVRSNGEIAFLMPVRQWTRERSTSLFTGIVLVGLAGAIGYAALSLRAAIHHQQFLAWFQTYRVEPPEQALRAMDRLIPGHEAEMRHWRARQLFDYGRLPDRPRLQQYAFFERAAELAQEAVWARPARGRYWALWARALAELGERERAVWAFERAVRLDPMNAEIRYDFGRYAVFLGDRERALAELSRARQLNPQLDLVQTLDLLSHVIADEHLLRRVLVSENEVAAFTAWYREHFERGKTASDHRK
ncbi:MAG: O-antigen ligase family protein [Blastocatellia bacterium]|nr:O-antigen ligase family protein [Blastocatellia bacterium]MCS7158464.1 O-antigen ligase family protein [Blastocatellia bacterium]MCX7753465.1 O-antigen ligase family protein [Blastocatellia bacterium]MDW8167855.1 O-antigen ligase family protein [Acidobacteriota bacterium]MDW8255890.1 O-antigen ligase family protein [Acidobacteriota bacterium]